MSFGAPLISTFMGSAEDHWGFGWIGGLKSGLLRPSLLASSACSQASCSFGFHVFASSPISPEFKQFCMTWVLGDG
jgi:hypothetical protein